HSDERTGRAVPAACAEECWRARSISGQDRISLVRRAPARCVPGGWDQTFHQKGQYSWAFLSESLGSFGFFGLQCKFCTANEWTFFRKPLRFISAVAALHLIKSRLLRVTHSKVQCLSVRR